MNTDVKNIADKVAAYSKEPTEYLFRECFYLLDELLSASDYQSFAQVRKSTDTLTTSRQRSAQSLLHKVWFNRPSETIEGLRFCPFAFPVMVSLPLDYVGYHPSWQPAFPVPLVREHDLADILELPDESPQRVFIYDRLLSTSTFDSFSRKQIHDYFLYLDTQMRSEDGINSLPVISVADRVADESPAFLDGHNLMVYPRLLFGFVLAENPVVQDRLLFSESYDRPFMDSIHQIISPVLDEYPGCEIQLGPCATDLDSATNTSIEWALGQSLLRRLCEDDIDPPSKITVAKEQRAQGSNFSFLFETPEGKPAGGVIFSLPKKAGEKAILPLMEIINHLKKEGYEIDSHIDPPTNVVLMTKYRSI